MISKMTAKDQGANPSSHANCSEERDAKLMILDEWKQVARFMQHVSMSHTL
ncbi:hypothetical protein SLH47_24730 [Cognatiyoonia sp. IB215182]|nr:hypothetical protein [Cognatiyoonia sp. IB215182]